MILKNMLWTFRSLIEYIFFLFGGIVRLQMINLTVFYSFSLKSSLALEGIASLASIKSINKAEPSVT